MRQRILHPLATILLERAQDRKLVPEEGAEGPRAQHRGNREERVTMIYSNKEVYIQRFTLVQWG